MAHMISVAALSFIVAAAPLSAANPRSAGPSSSDSATTRYCLWVEAPTGSRLETVRCWTRAQWAEQGIDVDKEWAEEGVAVRQ